jgi:hypothetical protein
LAFSSELTFFCAKLLMMSRDAGRLATQRWTLCDILLVMIAFTNLGMICLKFGKEYKIGFET